MSPPARSLPPPRHDGTYRVAAVCLGNICRSPIADVVLTQRASAAGLDSVEIDSFGTGGWHVGHPMDPRSAEVLRGAGYDPSRHRARQITAAQDGVYDLVLGMDAANVDDLRHLLPGDADRIWRFRDLDPTGPGDVEDPYYGGPDGFGDTLAVVERTADALVARLARRTGLDEPDEFGQPDTNDRLHGSAPEPLR